MATEMPVIHFKIFFMSQKKDDLLQLVGGTPKMAIFRKKNGLSQKSFIGSSHKAIRKELYSSKQRKAEIILDFLYLVAKTYKNSGRHSSYE